MADLREIKHILNTFISEVMSGSTHLEKTPLMQQLKENIYKFYHSEQDNLNEILPISELEGIDPMLTKTLVDDKTYQFPSFSPFFKGCISLMRSNS